MHVHFRRGKCSWDIEVYGKYNFIVGDSGTGKTHLADALQTSLRDGNGKMSGDINLVPLGFFLTGREDVDNDNTLVYVDEMDPLMWGSERERMFEYFRNSKCFFLIAMRDLPSTVPYGIQNVYKFVRSGNMHELKLAYELDYYDGEQVDTLVCEDSESGFLALQSILGDRVLSAGCRNNMSKECRNRKGNIAIFCDLCGLGNAVRDVVDVCNELPNTKVISSLSFEHTVLKSSIFNCTPEYTRDLYNVLSEEDFYTFVLSDKLYKTYGVRYGKSSARAIDLICRDKSWVPDVAFRQRSALSRTNLIKSMEF